VVDAIESVETEVKQTPYGDMRNWPMEDVVIVKAYMKEG
jgi:hypothetical protein